MTERIPNPETDPQASIDFLLSSLAQGMRAYDEQKAKAEQLHLELLPHQQILNRIDDRLPLVAYPAKVAYAALGSYLIDRRLQAVTRERHEIEWKLSMRQEPIQLLGQKFRLESLKPESYQIGTSRTNTYGQQDGLGQWHDVVEGKLRKLVLTPQDGGYIQLQGRMGKLFSTTKLVSRENDYQPAYKITIL